MKVTGKKEDGPEIRNLDSWFRHGGPTGEIKHWKDFRSAKELARAWCRYGVIRCPIELSTLFDQKNAFRGWELQQVVAEMLLSFDDNPRGNRNADLAGWGLFGPIGCKENFVFTIEAKADENFEGSVLAWKNKRIKNSPNSGAPERLEKLALGLFGRMPDKSIESLQYQLLPALAGTAVLGRTKSASRALLIIHEFISLSLDFDKVIKNSVAVEDFVRQIPGWENSKIKCGSLLPWIKLPGNKWIPKNVEVSVVKIRTLLPLHAGGRKVVKSYGKSSGQFIELE